jgi:hypothetical protein
MSDVLGGVLAMGIKEGNVTGSHGEQVFFCYTGYTVIGYGFIRRQVL